MATHTINGQPWPSGTLVNVYPADAQPSGHDGVPMGLVVDSATVSGASVTFGSLTEGRRYVAYAQGTSKLFLVQPGSVDTLRPITGAEAQQLREDIDERGEYVVQAGGGVFVTDDALIQSAVNAYAGERRVVLEGDFQIADSAPSITLPDYSYVEGRPGCTVTKGGVNQLPVFVAVGSIGTYVNLTGDAARGSRTLAVPTAGISVDDWLHLRSNKSWSTQPGLEQEVKQGEYVHVKAITDSGHLELESPLMDSYATADVSRVAEVTFRRDVTFKGVHWICSTPGTGNGGLMHGRYTWGLTIEDTSAQDFSGIVHYCFSGLHTKVTRVHGQNGGIDSGFGYTVDLSGCTQGATVSQISGHNGRNLISCDGAQDGGVPRDCMISNCSISGRWAVGGFHTHICAERIHYSNCVGTGKFVSGMFHLSGRHCTVTGGEGGDIEGSGVYLQDGSENCVVEGCSFKNIYGPSAGITDTGVSNRILSTYVENVVDYSSAFYTEGTGCVIKNCIAKPGAGKIGLSTYDSSDTWVCDGLTVLGPALIGVNYGIPGAVVPTPRVLNLVTTSDVTTPCNAAAAVISRAVMGEQAIQFAGAKLIEQGADLAAPVVEGGVLYTKNLASGNPGSGLYFRDTQRVMVVLGQLQGSTTWNPGSLADGAVITTTVAVPGAVIGEPVVVSFPVLVAGVGVAGIEVTGQVAAANSVTVVLRNDSGVARDLDSGALKVLVFKW